MTLPFEVGIVFVVCSPKTNLKSAGFTPEERASFKAVYMDQGFVGEHTAGACLLL